MGMEYVNFRCSVDARFKILGFRGSVRVYWMYGGCTIDFRLIFDRCSIEHKNGTIPSPRASQETLDGAVR